MAVRDHVTRVAKLRAKIVTVEPSQRLIEAVTAEGGNPRRIAIFDIPTGFQWPKEGEDWSIFEENGYWRLGNRFLNAEEDATFTTMDPGTTLAPDDARTLDGGAVINAYGTPSDGALLEFNSTTDRTEWVTPFARPALGISRFTGRNLFPAAPHTPGGQEVSWMPELNIDNTFSLINYGVRNDSSGVKCNRAGYYEVLCRLLTYANVGTGRYDAEFRIDNVVKVSSLIFLDSTAYGVQETQWMGHLSVNSILSLVGPNGAMFEGNTWTYIQTKWLGV